MDSGGDGEDEEDGQGEHDVNHGDSDQGDHDVAVEAIVGEVHEDVRHVEDEEESHGDDHNDVDCSLTGAFNRFVSYIIP